jgi:anti-sigma B factor antagonist
MELDTDVDGGVGDGAAVIRLKGRLTMVVAPRLRTLVTETVQQGRTRIVVDLAGCEFIDSSGLGALVAGLKATRQAGGDLRIACLAPQVATVLKLTNLDRVLRPYDSVHGALSA